MCFVWMACRIEGQGMEPDAKFVVLIGVSLIVFASVVSFVLRQRQSAAPNLSVAALAVVICAGGMVFARYGAQMGLPWTIYYSIPAVATVFAPPILLAMSWRETMTYLVLSSMSAPAIHAAFSFLLGWPEYMPFLKVPYWRDVLGAAI
jgi:hypothetical protein